MTGSRLGNCDFCERVSHPDRLHLDYAAGMVFCPSCRDLYRMRIGLVREMYEDQWMKGLLRTLLRDVENIVARQQEQTRESNHS